MTTNELRMTLSCYRCGGFIRGEAKSTRPDRSDPTDFARSFHPTCYALAEAEAEAELKAGPLLGSVWDSIAGNRWEVVAILSGGRVRVRHATEGHEHVWDYSSVTGAGMTRVK